MEGSTTLYLPMAITAHFVACYTFSLLWGIMVPSEHKDPNQTDLPPPSWLIISMGVYHSFVVFTDLSILGFIRIFQLLNYLTAIAVFCELDKFQDSKAVFLNINISLPTETLPT